MALRLPRNSPRKEIQIHKRLLYFLGGFAYSSVFGLFIGIDGVEALLKLGIAGAVLTLMWAEHCGKVPKPEPEVDQGPITLFPRVKG